MSLFRRHSSRDRDARVARVRADEYVLAVEESVELAHPAEKVWALVSAAETTPLLVRSIARGGHVPGTPVGLGERQFEVTHDGEMAVFEVVEYDDGRRAVVEQVEPAAAVPMRVVFAVEPIDGGGCRLVHQVLLGAQVAGQVSAQAHEQLRLTSRRYLERVGAVLDEGWPDLP